MSSRKGPVSQRVFTPPYEPTKVQTLTASGTVVPGSANYVIVVEYHTQQNKGTADLVTTPSNGTVPFNDGNTLPYTPGQNFFSFAAIAPGREWRCSPGTAFVVSLSTSGSVVTNTRYWYEEYP